MSIKIDIIDNSSEVRVKPKAKEEVRTKIETKDGSVLVKPDSSDNIHTCVTSDSSLQKQIDAEILARKKADEELESQIIHKQDRIYFIDINQSEGTLAPTVLNLLISSRLNKLVYLDNVYSLSYKGNEYYRYTGGSTDPNYINTITVNVTTGDYYYESISNVVLRNHITNQDRHLRPGEREFWNNKLNFEAEGELLEFNRD